MLKFSTKWKKSKKPKKQRKYLFNAPKHLRNKFLHAKLSDDLVKKIGNKTIRVRKEDKVKVMKGQFKGIVGKVERVDTKNLKLYINGVEIQKKDGSKVKYPIHVSNILIVDLYTTDKKRLKKNNL